MKLQILKFAAFLVMFSIIMISCNQSRQGKPNVLVFTKTAGYHHNSIKDGIKALQKLANENDFKIDTTSIANIFTQDSLKKYATVIFLNTTGDLLNYREQAEFQKYIEAGGGYLGIHAAVDAEYNWPWYGKLVGAYFKNHPKIQEASLNLKTDSNFKVIESLPNPWNRTDEWYNFKEIPQDVHVLASIDEKSYEGGNNGENHPMVWYHEFDGGRSFYMALGHTPESYKDPDFLNLLKSGIDYTVGKNNKLDYSKATTLSVPDADRFAKKVLGTGFDEPTEISILPHQNILIAERKGAIKYYNNTDSSVTKVADLNVYKKALHTENVNVEFGVLGLQADPFFAKNNWVYVYYSPMDKSVDRLSRFKFESGDFHIDSEEIILEVATDREICCHTGGSIAFDSKNNLYLSTGDNSTPFDEIDASTGKAFAINSHGFAPLDDREGKYNYDVRRSSGNTNDLRGKILRIHVNEDGSYNIPPGNLFAKDEAKARPEIYVMGNRNPYRISIDKKTDFLYWGEVGPDANNDSLATRGARGYDEVNQARVAGNFGWPYFIGKNLPYHEYNYETGESGPAFNDNKVLNNSRNNTGLKELPPAQPAFIAYPYALSEDYPILGKGGRTAMAGPVYHIDDFPDDTRYPEYYNNKLFIYDWVRDWIMAVSMNDSGDLETIEPFMENTSFKAISDMEVGPDGQFYIVEYGKGWYSKNEGADLSVITYNKGNRPPVVDISLDKDAGNLPLVIHASASNTYDPDGDKLTYSWDMGNGKTIETNENTISYTYDKAGVYDISLTVRDNQGGETKSSYKSAYAGNNRPNIDIKVDGNSSFYFPNKAITYTVIAEDTEDGVINNTEENSNLYITAEYLASLDKAGSHTANTVNNSQPGKKLMQSLDCIACHKVNEKYIGPSFTQVAIRYKNDSNALNFLPKKILQGGSGNWGEVAMAGHPDLPEEDAKKIVSYILSLNEDQQKARSLPVHDSFLPSNKFQLNAQGDVIITASYTDRGTSEVPPLEGTSQKILKNPVLKLEQSTISDGVSDGKIRGKQMKFINKSSWIKFSQLDLYGINSVLIDYGLAEVTNSGWDIELHIDNPQGPLLGRQKIGIETKPRIPSEAILKITDIKDNSLHDVYFLFKKIDNNEKGGFALSDLTFKAE